MDSITREKRSINMAHIRSRDTQAERVVRYLLFYAGYRYRIAPKQIEGRPDIYIAKRNAAIFVHGCFWHHHEKCRYATTPKSNTPFWEEKFRRNRERDRKTEEALRKKGIRVLIVWECSVRGSLKSEGDLEYLKDRMIAFIENDRMDRAEI